MTSDRPVMLLSAGNVLANLRGIDYLKGYTQKPLAVSEETAKRFPSCSNEQNQKSIFSTQLKKSSLKKDCYFNN